MRRTARLSLVICLVAALAPLAATTPASAKSCAGQGLMRLSRKIGLPVVGAQSNVGFSIVTKCLGGLGPPTVTATGNIASAACGRSTGGTGTVNGKRFKFQSFGTLFIVNGKVDGFFNAVPDARRGDNCANGTADDFLVNPLVLKRL